MSTRLDAQLVSKAVGALLKFDEKRKSSAGSRLIEDFAKPINAQIQLLADIATPVLKPVRVRIPHTIFNPTGEEEHNVCVFCRSEDAEALKTFLAANSGVIPGLDAAADGSVLSINDVKKYYKEFKQLKQLSQRFTHFLCDARIMSQLYNLLGKSFGSRNNYPIPIDFKQVEKLPAAASKALHASTYIHLKGKCINVRLGNTNMPKDQLVQNALQGLEFAAAEKLPKGWAGVHSVSLKLADSAALPIYARDANDAGVAFIRDAGADGKAKSEAGAGAGAVGSSSSKGSKRPREEETAPAPAAVKAAKITASATAPVAAKAATPAAKPSTPAVKAATPAVKAATPAAAKPSTPSSAAHANANAKTATPAQKEKSPLSVFKSATPKGTVLKKQAPHTPAPAPAAGATATPAAPATTSKGKTPSKADAKFKEKLTPEGARVRKSSRGK